MIFKISPRPSFPKRGNTPNFPPLAKGGEGRFQSGFTLLELLIAIALMAMIVGALDQVAARVLSTYSAVQAGQDLVPQARYALERMVAFVQASDKILTPSTIDPTEALVVSEQYSDQYTNSSRVYTAAGDGRPDADTDADGLVNEDSGDPAEFITFDLDKSDGSNWLLMEKMPDYGTSATDDFKTPATLCEHVQAFACKRLSAGIVEITLTLQQGSKTVSLRTTAKAQWVN
ncbi:MAG TPA: prepilin-type N-terminal cleavage/methylation domain-containing protein [Syntrophales bacterium]|nr:prepilin-type N-terminal cleavage/methylation domain-containing protein [Syntrophales bacterium]